jgi:arginine/ornithine N-succinyltransferase beta subunit
MNNKKPKINKNLTTLAFVDKETNSLVIHVHGFENSDIAEAFASYMLSKSGMSYETASDIFDTIPTIH